ncbi:acyl carrier protein, partial [Acinetobacter baumannii]
MNKDKAYWSAIIRTLVAKEVRVEPETIDSEQKFTSFGLDSIVAW